MLPKEKSKIAVSYLLQSISNKQLINYNHNYYYLKTISKDECIKLEKNEEESQLLRSLWGEILASKPR